MQIRPCPTILDYCPVMGLFPLHCTCQVNLSRKLDIIHEVVHESAAVEVLLDYGVDVDQLDGLGRTPLYLAAGGGFKDTCKVLIKRGASVNSIRSYCTGMVERNVSWYLS